MKMKRLFLSISLPEKLIQEISLYLTKKEIKSILSSSSGRITDPENLHITVFFLGNMDEKHIRALNETLGNTIRNKSAFIIKTSSIIAVPTDNQPRMIWLTPEKNAYFESLYHSVIKSVKEFCVNKNIKIAPLYSKPSPHVTLARFKKYFRIHSLPRFKPADKRILCAEVNLMESVLNPGGPTYIKLNSYKLRN